MPAALSALSAVSTAPAAVLLSMLVSSHKAFGIRPVEWELSAS